MDVFIWGQYIKIEQAQTISTKSLRHATMYNQNDLPNWMGKTFTTHELQWLYKMMIQFILYWTQWVNHTFSKFGENSLGR